MSLTTGGKIGPYEIVSLLGKGGMGEVYKARDVRLDRFVALKLLPSDQFTEPENRRRFLAEAKAASALRHPNIVTIYDVLGGNGEDVLVMEFVSGHSLDRLISRKGLPLSRVLRYAIQCADALAAAHAAGIVHRDIKPANIMIDEQDSVRLLDFGLAKFSEEHGGIGDLERTQTAVNASPKTEEGTILGTAAYMSPEQAEGKPLDARSDIFSLGSLLHEMVTGEKAFTGDSLISTLGCIIRDEPKPVTKIAEDAPRDLEKVITRCLRKDPARRFQHVDDVKVELAELRDELDSGKLDAVPVANSKKKPHPLTWAASVAIVAIAAAAGVLSWRHSAPQFEVAFSPIPLTSALGREESPSFSPDGNQVAYSWNGEKRDNVDIYVKVIGAGEPLRLTTDPADEFRPAWSPDGKWIAFLKRMEKGRLAEMLISPLGGQARKVGEINTLSHIAWSPDGKWLAAAEELERPGPYSLVLTSTNTGEQHRLTRPISTIVGDINPSFSPDGRGLVFERWTGSIVSEIQLLSLGSNLQAIGEPRALTSNHKWNFTPVFAANGREIVFCFQQNGGPGTSILMKMPLEATSEPHPLSSLGSSNSSPAISLDGHKLAYSATRVDLNIWRLPLTGRRPAIPLRIVESAGYHAWPNYSPDGTRIAFESNRSGNGEIWISRSDGSGTVQVTRSGRGNASSPRWSPDGSQLVYTALDDQGSGHIYSIAQEGGTVRQIVMRERGGYDAVVWSADGKWIYFSSHEIGIWRIAAQGGPPIQLTPEMAEWMGESPDDHWLYYSRGDEISGPLWRIPSQGGREERVLENVYWRNVSIHSKAIYYLQAASSRRLRKLDLVSGRDEVIADLPDARASIFGLSISPDERWAIYADDQSGQNIMLVEDFH